MRLSCRLDSGLQIIFESHSSPKAFISGCVYGLLGPLKSLRRRFGGIIPSARGYQRSLPRCTQSFSSVQTSLEKSKEIDSCLAITFQNFSFWYWTWSFVGTDISDDISTAPTLTEVCIYLKLSPLHTIIECNIMRLNNYIQWWCLRVYNSTGILLQLL